MNLVEQAIRAALSKGNAADQAFRRKIYGSASAALERSLTARTYSEDEIKQRRQNFLSTIRHIESEFIVAAEAGSEAPEVTTSRAGGLNNSASLEVAPVVSANRSETAGVAISPATLNTGNEPSRPVKIPPVRKSRPWFIYALNGAFLLALILGGYWVYQEGSRIYADATSSKPSSQKPALSEANATTSQSEEVEWIQIFSSNDTDLLSSGAGAKTEIVSRDGGNFVAMSGDGTNEVTVKIGSGLVQTFAGKRILFSIKARSANGSTLDTGAYCEFGEGTKCDRKRFKVTSSLAEFMFAVSVSASANGDAKLLIAPDLSAGGNAVEVESIRATIVNPDAG